VKVAHGKILIFKLPHNEKLTSHLPTCLLHAWVCSRLLCSQRSNRSYFRRL